MGKRPAAAKATRGVSKAKVKAQSSSSCPKTTKFRSQYNSLSVIAKGGPSKKNADAQSSKAKAREARRREKFLNDLDDVEMTTYDDDNHSDTTGQTARGKKKQNKKTKSVVSAGSRKTAASFASVWSQCTNTSLDEFFQTWDPKLNTHKDALAVIAGLSQMMTNEGKEQSNELYAKTLLTLVSSTDTPKEILTGALFALTFVMRKMDPLFLKQNFDLFYPVLKKLMEVHHDSRKKTLVKSLLRCFACLSKAHPLGKDSIEKGLRKIINNAIRQKKVQDKIHL